MRPLLRAVATAFPQARIELWAVDEHRIGLKPILHKVWCFDGQRPTAPVQHRYDWRYLVGFVHPCAGYFRHPTTNWSGSSCPTSSYL